jgi:hypothetical protein
MKQSRFTEEQIIAVCQCRVNRAAVKDSIIAPLS